MAFFAKIPLEVAETLIAEDRASQPRTKRNTAQLIVETLTNTAVLVTILQTPDTLLRLQELMAAWRTGFVPTTDDDDTGQIIIRTKHEQIVLPVDGDADARSLAALVEDALE